MRMNKKAYITLLTDDSYIYGVILLNESLKETNAQYPLVVLVTSNVSTAILNILELLQLQYIVIEPIIYNNIIEYNKKINPALTRTWSLCLSKLIIFNLTQFDKLVFLDADIMIMKNLDHLFECPHLTSALDGEYFNIWPGWDHFNSGIMVIEPNSEEYNKIINFISNLALKEEWRPGECIADLEILNHYYKDWVNKPELRLNKYYDIFAPYIQENQENDIDTNCYFIHFVGRKPWRAFKRAEHETYTEKYYTIAHKLILKKVNTLDWNLAKKYLKVAIYGICKNEISNIDKYIKCFTEANYLCLLDTGSTDGTWEYLQLAQKEYPNLIIKQSIISPWRFDTARNESLTLVPEDTSIYFMMDLDEIIKEKGWCQLIRNSWNPLFLRGGYAYNRFVDENSGLPIHSFTEYRIHNKMWHYEGIVHEQLIDLGGQRNLSIDECIMVPITVWHYPTNNDKMRYITLCQLSIKEDPNNWLMHLQLAAEYEVNGLNEEAKQEYKTIIMGNNTLEIAELGRCYASLGRLTENKEIAMRIFELGMAICPNFGDNYFLAAELQYNKKNFLKTFDLCKAGLDNTTMNYWCTTVKRDGHYPYLLMGLSKFYLGFPIEALGYITIAKKKNNNDEMNKIFKLIISLVNNGR